MKKTLKTITMALILSTSYGVSAADGDFTGNVSFQAPHTHATNAQRVVQNGIAGDHDSSIVFTEKASQLSFAEKLASNG
ncbi:MULTISPECIES: hypothetical protein [unclassified Photobacterium]|uniref:hypothetical protein n=1 Tax=unclassified Photobacterium TaxID=2628852 RepID=UPI001EDE8323|nr:MULTISPECIES: hypothetical protein [unclassified Photobacterium]MCG3863407.1 hypothetical protein [Photobacterium sp. Ph6]MCG3874936.1 hypothetical protein [Photobacterium sp. Ph5]